MAEPMTERFGKYVCVLYPGKVDALFAVPEGRDTVTVLRAGFTRPPSLLAVENVEWSQDLSPWKAPAVYREEEGFAGGGEAFAKLLTREIVPWAQDSLHTHVPVGLLGYSLAGLFALYTAIAFSGYSMAASVSGSLWYEGFTSYVEHTRLPDGLRKVYLSLGRKEPQARNPMLCQVGSSTEEVYQQIMSKGIETTLEWNPGNHFTDPTGRMARALNWLLQGLNFT